MNEHICDALIKSGQRNGQQCGSHAQFLNPFTQEWTCKRHCKLKPEELRRLDSKVLCYYGEGLNMATATHDVDAAVAELAPDPIGDINMKVLKGYINVRIGTPFLYESLPLVYMSKLQGLGDDFTRASLAKCLQDTIKYIFSRPDAYVWQHGAYIDTLYLTAIRFDNMYGNFVAELLIK